MRAISTGAVLVGLGLLASACGGGAADGAARPRNVLFVCVDTLRADHLGAYGADPSPSPAIDAFARSAVLFERAYSHASWTLPSFAAILTSLYSSSTGTWTKESRLGEGVTTLPERFQAAGFETYGIASHIFFDRDFGLQQGFEGFDDEYCRKRGDEGWVHVTSPGVTAKAERWLADPARRERPWFLWVHYFDPHVPYVPHDGTSAAGADEHALYRDEIAFTDHYVGELLASLERLDFADDTVVVFVADHGEAFLEHPGIRHHSYSLFDEEIHVPLAIRVPGLAPRRVSDFVRTVDVAPTLCELFGIPLDDDPVEGKSLGGALEGRPFEAPPLLSELRLYDGFHARSVIDGRYKLIEDLSHGGTKLYDLIEDPGETRDLAPERADLVLELGAKLAELEGQASALAPRYAAGTVELDEGVQKELRALGYGGEQEVTPPKDADAADETAETPPR